jgi:small subunit ribosomal protein S9
MEQDNTQNGQDERPADGAAGEQAQPAPEAPEAGTPPSEPEVPSAAAPEEIEPESVPPEPETVDEASEATVEAPVEAPAEEGPAAVEEAPRTLTELAAGARYIATGKRKSSVARVILTPGGGDFVLNGRPLEIYFPRRTHQVVVKQPLEAAGFVGRVNVVARIHGGGISGQADALRHGIAKALIEADPALRGELKRRQLLTRDPRVKERRKAGLKKARKRPQFSKR